MLFIHSQGREKTDDIYDRSRLFNFLCCSGVFFVVVFLRLCLFGFFFFLLLLLNYWLTRVVRGSDYRIEVFIDENFTNIVFEATVLDTFALFGCY